MNHSEHELKKTTDDKLARKKPRALVIQAQAMLNATRSDQSRPPLAVAVSADDISKALGDTFELTKLKEELRRDYTIVSEARPSEAPFVLPEFQEIFLQSVALSYEHATQACVYAVWTGVRGRPQAAKVQYVFVAEGAEKLINFGADASKAFAALSPLPAVTKPSSLRVPRR
ncbi:hypothetical protein LU699_12985 [Luteimonas fraxinea]|uniref:Uncharacterized protein n=1 Tax=Luteimonas fraxinea TaxID=2901869 RepID=A0ABS8UH60_9GAMM|nr:hypothetical protein [Luteimonas fraxinea]MCD9098071.1 hypothetical protein [Luteimonas fraxinea]UHH09203.1 hypothetical protein LU699_12985 [Luteimonas fraxinea]